MTQTLPINIVKQESLTIPKQGFSVFRQDFYNALRLDRHTLLNQLNELGESYTDIAEILPKIRNQQNLPVWLIIRFCEHYLRNTAQIQQTPDSIIIIFSK